MKLNSIEGERRDIEMAFIRILSVGGLILSGDGMSHDDRRERIRVAIYDQNLEHKAFDSEFTFGQAYKQCYHRAIDMRKVPRKIKGATRAPLTDEEGDL